MVFQLLSSMSCKIEVKITRNEEVLISLPVKLTRAALKPEAEIVVHPADYKQPPVTCYLLRCEPPPILVTIREKTGVHPLRGISAVWKDTDAADASLVQPGDLKFILKLKDKKSPGNPVDLWHLDPENEIDMKRRSIPAHGQMELSVQFPELPAEDHKTTLTLLATNLRPGKEPEIKLAVKVRDTIGYALLVLAGSVFLSYLATKGLRSYALTLELQRRIRKLDESHWLKNDCINLLPFVQARAVLSRTRKTLSRERKFGKSASVINDVQTKLDQLDKRLPYLQRMCSLYAFWKRSNEDQMVKRRARKCLRKIFDDFSKIPLEDDLPQALENQLSSLEDWEDHKRLTELYWTNMKYDLEQIKSKIEPADFDPNKEALTDLKKILTDLTNTVTSLLTGDELKGQLEELIDELASRGSTTSFDELTNLLQVLNKIEVPILKSLDSNFENLMTRVEALDHDGIGPASLLLSQIKETEL